MSLTMKPKPARRTLIVERWLDTLDTETRNEALEYLHNPTMYAHTELARIVTAHLGTRVTEKTISGWRERNL